MSRRIIGYRFTVEGTGVFPFDMLRYDGCYPARQEDASAVSAGYHHDGLPGLRTVELLAKEHAPTEARWASFGWSVVDVEVIR